MAISAEDRPPDRLVDTSIAIALLVPDHHHHESTFEAVGQLRLGLAGHAAFETYSVLTRLPAPARRSPSAASRLLAVNFPASRFLEAQDAKALLEGLAGGNVAGGQVYDALVGATAKHHGIVLVTRDHRALATYRSIDVRFEMLQ